MKGKKLSCTAWESGTGVFIHKIRCGIRVVTPNHRHTGIDKAILANRHQVYQKAKTINPERWTGQTRNWSLPDTVTLNPNRKNKQNDPAASNDAELTPALEFNK